MGMTVGLCRVSLRLPENHSLKGKRQVVKSLIARLHNKLSNEKFVANAPEEVVEAEREKHAEYREAQEKLSVALTRVRDAG